MPTALEILTVAATAGQRAHVISIRHEARHAGNLLEVGESWVTVRLPEASELQPMETVSVAFSMGPRAYTFLAVVLDLDLDENRVFLSMPDDVLHTERRLVPRTPVDAMVSVELPAMRPARIFPLVDISPTGMRLRTGTDNGLTVGDRIRAILRYEELSLELLAEVRHIHQDSTGFYFPDSVRHGRLNPKPELVELVKRLGKG